MSLRLSRRGLAVAILAVWVGVFVWHVRREIFRPEAERLAAAVRTLPPGAAYYAVYRGKDRAGWAQAEIDTLPGGSGLFLRDRLFLELPGLGPSGTMERSTESWLGAGLGLDSLRHVAVSAGDSVTVVGVVQGDSLLRMEVRESGRRDSVTLGLEGPVQPPGAWPLRLAAGGRARPGDRYQFLLFDPVTRSSQRAAVRVMEQRMRTYPDSADSDTLTGVWFAVREDTVQAWRVARQAGAIEFETWIDEDGRFLEAELPGGLRIERTAFELAFFTRERNPAE